MKMKVTLEPLDYTRRHVMEFDLDSISYAIGVALRANIDDDERAFMKIRAIKTLREERGHGLLEAKTLIEFADEMIKQCEGLKLAAALNPLD